MVVKCKKNYYDILELTPDSDQAEIKASYRHLARKYHPDINKAPDSAQKFKDLLEAYETLCDNNKRKNYDMVNGFYKTPKHDFCKKNKNPEYDKSNLRQKTTTENSKPQNTQSKEKSFEKSNNKKETFNKKEKQENQYTSSFFRDTVNSILDEISKNHGEAKNSKISPKNGDDVYTEISIDFSESISGTQRVLNIMHKEVCPHCQGRKFINGTNCPKCSGTGIYELKRKITVKIPAGIKNNTKLRLAGEGNPGFYGGKDGNLYITIKVEHDKNMQIEGNNILYKLSITPYDAVLGSEFKIPTYAENIKFSVPSMTKSGQQFRISNKGIKTNGHVGDMIITVEIQIPEKLSDEEISLYEKLRQLDQNN